MSLNSIPWGGILISLIPLFIILIGGSFGLYFIIRYIKTRNRQGKPPTPAEIRSWGK